MVLPAIELLLYNSWHKFAGLMLCASVDDEQVWRAYHNASLYPNLAHLDRILSLWDQVPGQDGPPKAESKFRITGQHWERRIYTTVRTTEFWCHRWQLEVFKWFGSTGRLQQSCWLSGILYSEITTQPAKGNVPQETSYPEYLCNYLDNQRCPGRQKCNSSSSRFLFHVASKLSQLIFWVSSQSMLMPF